MYLYFYLSSFFLHFDNSGPLHESHYQLTSDFCFIFFLNDVLFFITQLRDHHFPRIPWTDNSQADYKRPVAISPPPCTHTVAAIGWWSVSNLLLLLTKLVCHYWVPGSVLDMHLIFTKSRGQLLFFTYKRQDFVKWMSLSKAIPLVTGRGRT